MSKSMMNHPFANVFPMLGKRDLQTLAEDIRLNGLRTPIVIDSEDLILDGRNRHSACVIAGVEPVFEPFIGTDKEKLAFVVSSNLHRRHLTPSQTSMCAARARELYEQQAKERAKLDNASKENLPDSVKGQARDAAGKAFGVSGKSVDFAKKVIDKGIPELAKAVDEGRMAVSTAAVLALEPEDVQRAEVSNPKRNRTYSNQKGTLHPNAKEHVKTELFAMSTADVAITQLKGIPEKNKFRDTAFARVKKWIDSQRNDKTDVDRINDLIRAELSRWPEDQRADAIKVFEQCVSECSMELGTNSSSLGALFPDAIEPKPKERTKPSDAEFEAFYSAFPRRVNKAKAKVAFAKAFNRLRKSMTCEIAIKTIMDGARVYAENADPDALCHPTTWLNGDRWEDDPSGIGKQDRKSRNLDNAMLGAYEERERTPLSEAVF